MKALILMVMWLPRAQKHLSTSITYVAKAKAKVGVCVPESLRCVSLNCKYQAHASVAKYGKREISTATFGSIK